MKKTNVMLASLFSAFLLIVPPVMAEDSVSDETSLSVTISSALEAQAVLTQSWIFPVMQGTGPLTKDNNVRLNAAFAVTPISLFGDAEAVWTPIAFIQVMAGTHFGSGWNYNLFGGMVKGIGINDRTGVIGDPFAGLIWNARAAALFQFDLAAVIPGDWLHIVFQTQHEFKYNAYTAASATDTWYIDNDEGENRNGWNYYGNFILGYQMPIFLDMIAFMAEMNQYLTVLPGGEYWGDPLPRWTFSFLGNFKINDRIGIALVTQLTTARNATEATQDNAYYRDRQLTDAAIRHRLEFYRVALIANFKLR
jgi:hypothetical protein